MSNNSIRPIDRTQSSGSTSVQSGPGSNDNEGVLRIPPKLKDYRNLTIRLFNVIYQDIRGGIFPYIEMQSVYSLAPPDWATLNRNNYLKFICTQVINMREEYLITYHYVKIICIR